jgi:hypothetical protein
MVHRDVKCNYSLTFLLPLTLQYVQFSHACTTDDVFEDSYYFGDIVDLQKVALWRDDWRYPMHPDERRLYLKANANEWFRHSITAFMEDDQEEEFSTFM